MAGSGADLPSPRAARRRWRSSSVDGPPKVHTRGRATLAHVEKSVAVGIAWPGRLTSSCSSTSGTPIRCSPRRPGRRASTSRCSRSRGAREVTATTRTPAAAVHAAQVAGRLHGPLRHHRRSGGDLPRSAGASRWRPNAFTLPRAAGDVISRPRRFEGEALGRPDRWSMASSPPGRAWSGGSSSAAPTTPTTAASTTSATPCRTSACSSSAPARW